MKNYGKTEGLSDRLNDWAEQLNKDRRFPWIGTGIIADLRAAADAIDGKPAAKKVEYDL